MPILKVLDYDSIVISSANKNASTHTLSPQTKQLCLALLTNAKKHFAWEPRLNESDQAEALAMVAQAIAEITIEVI